MAHNYAVKSTGITTPAITYALSRALNYLYLGRPVAWEHAKRLGNRQLPEGHDE